MNILFFSFDQRSLKGSVCVLLMGFLSSLAIIEYYRHDAFFAALFLLLVSRDLLLNASGFYYQSAPPPPLSFLSLSMALDGCKIISAF